MPKSYRLKRHVIWSFGEFDSHIALICGSLKTVEGEDWSRVEMYAAQEQIFDSKVTSLEGKPVADPCKMPRETYNDLDSLTFEITDFVDPKRLLELKDQSALGKAVITQLKRSDRTHGTRRVVDKDDLTAEERLRIVAIAIMTAWRRKSGINQPRSAADFQTIITGSDINQEIDASYKKTRRNIGTRIFDMYYNTRSILTPFLSQEDEGPDLVAPKTAPINTPFISTNARWMIKDAEAWEHLKRDAE